MNVTAVARRDGRWWAISVPEVEGAFTQTRRLDQVPDMVADAVGMLLEIDPATVEVTVEPHTDRDSLVAEAREAREAADQAANIASAAMRKAARELLDDGLTVRDAGRLLEVSPQRISQLVA